MLGVDPPREVDGGDLLSGGSRPLLMETRRESALRQSHWKLRVDKPAATSSGSGLRERLFEIRGEEVHQVEAAETLRDLVETLERLRDRPPLAPSISRFDLDEKHRRELEALGYL